MVGLGLALFIATAAGGNFFLSPQRQVSLRSAGYDFLAFYTAGTFVRTGQLENLYDLDAVRAFQHDLSQRHGMELRPDAVGPFWNPPIFAWVFAPLSAMTYPSAFLLWTILNLACFAAAMVILCRTVARSPRPCFRGGRPHEANEREAAGAAGCMGEAPMPREISDWRTWALVPLLTLTSMPFIMSIGHGQNTCVSLLILAGAVALWRGERFFAAGVVAGLLFYKPQLGAVVAAMMIVCCGWRALAGLATTGTILLFATLLTLPGTLATFLAKMPRNLAFMQVEHRYLWDRHVTLKSFWRLLVQGYQVGETSTITTALTVVTALAVGACAFVCVVKLRGRGPGRADAGSRDQIISITILSMPLLMPFYFDYDLLLLAVPAALAAAHGQSMNRRTIAAWIALYAWLIVNPHMAALTRVNGTVILLAAVAGMTMWTAMKERSAGQSAAATEKSDPITPSRRAAA
ncbi:MAG: alpha,2-mannosyltransferase [Phycisphaerales bacterium]|nr:alpha,2-mannosyltransferase [Phycisphaerales bacterium]